MKSSIGPVAHKSLHVAPLVGAWIEIVWMWLQYWMRMVAPLVGAWIEIFRKVIERDALIVAPLVGAWIEI